MQQPARLLQSRPHILLTTGLLFVRVYYQAGLPDKTEDAKNELLQEIILVKRRKSFPRFSQDQRRMNPPYYSFVREPHSRVGLSGVLLIRVASALSLMLIAQHEPRVGTAPSPFESSANKVHTQPTDPEL